jgi:predicted SAM-dependent methyltransferase
VPLRLRPGQAIRLNIGCGRSPTPDWINYDNSPSVWLARWPMLAALLVRLGLIDRHALDFVAFCRSHCIRHADAARRIPHRDGTVDAIYASHMLEHLDRVEARSFLAECRRALKPGAILRLAVPDLRHAAYQYLRRSDADGFLSHLQFDLDKPRGPVARLRRLLGGGRGHHWMYDRDSLVALVEAAGFADVEPVEEGRTRIAEPGSLDLNEREVDSLCIEARRP